MRVLLCVIVLLLIEATIGNTMTRESNYLVDNWSPIEIDNRMEEVAFNWSRKWNQNNSISENFFKVKIKNAFKQDASNNTFKFDVTLLEIDCDIKAKVCYEIKDGNILICTLTYFHVANKTEIIWQECSLNPEEEIETSAFYSIISPTTENSMSIVHSSFHLLILSLVSIFLLFGFT